MPSHDTNVRLRHMLDAAREAAQMVQGKTLQRASVQQHGLENSTTLSPLKCAIEQSGD